jgi:predicted kinase
LWGGCECFDIAGKADDCVLPGLAIEQATQARVAAQAEYDKTDNLVELLAKSKETKNPKLSRTEARVKVWHEKPDLVAAWRLASKT